ncbi:hypothetical protein ACN2CX_05595 [Aliarcobacter butzleri]|uniref:hypothetical protein n=1 Tax=Aliarcobacter butzleri TaxID=28197 RepID=UPI001EDC6BE9|nr:hypothetical protein [Aliarcobacter butzleri]MCG3711470.1 hypothetical protein [Aliarcobacter butzleri]MCG3715893.1 hypothetical protein [Aliarcobacter butzleri]MCT7632551.1 hypothetical protein [Aliarcobacter butzleri]MCT7651136.1 hypothetical protein [Aliarcobacter butzleri]
MTNAETISKLNNALTTLIKAYEELQEENSGLKGKVSELEEKVLELELSNEDLEKDINQLKGHTEEDKSNLSSILGKIENILNRKVETTSTNVSINSFDFDSKEDEIKEEVVEEKKEEENILNLDSNSFANVLQQKDEKKEESNKLDLSRMSSLLNGFNH